MLNKILGKASAIMALLAALLVPGVASAITVDGLYTDGEGYTDSDDLGWWNDHESIYTESNAGGPVAGYPLLMQTSTMHYKETDTTLNLYVQVPTYARRMIWVGVDDKDSNAFEYDGTGCDPDCGGIPKDILDAYLEGSHHESGVKMDYDTQTKSEYFQLNEGSKDTGLKVWLQEEGSKSYDGNTVSWKTSREYVLANGCTTALCLALEMPMAIELEWTGLDTGEANTIRTNITKLQLHLSDEARGLPPISTVPVPAAFWLFGSALIGFIGMSRRTSVS